MQHAIKEMIPATEVAEIYYIIMIMITWVLTILNKGQPQIDEYNKHAEYSGTSDIRSLSAAKIFASRTRANIT